MNQKEVGEIRRRFAVDKGNINHIYGCYINSSKQIVCTMDTSVMELHEQEATLYFGLLKKAMSGTLGKNLLDLVFDTAQVEDSEEHRLLQTLRMSALKDEQARQTLYQKIIDALEPSDTGYLILLAADRYDVPYKGKDDLSLDDASDSVFEYFVCSICPVKEATPTLQFDFEDDRFAMGSQVLRAGAPEFGFLFPTFDERRTNIYNVLFYSRHAAVLPHGLIDAVFHTEVPMSAAEQREAFDSALREALGDACSLETVQAIHEQICEQIAQHKESKNPEPLILSMSTVGNLLRDCGVPEDRTQAFEQACSEYFEGAAIKPENIIDSKRFEVVTGQAKLTIDPMHSYLLKARVVDGRRCLLVPIEEGMQVNGIDITMVEQGEGETQHE